MADLRIITTMGAGTVLKENLLQELSESFRGKLLHPADEGYGEARSIWNAAHDRKPALILRCAGVSDIIHSVNFARTHNIPVAVRGGGHNVSGSATCDDGLMLDLSRLKSVRVDPTTRTARAEPGLTWAELDRETQEFGLATTGGVCSEAGIAGVSLGGGEGWLMRKHGLALDNLLSVDVVCADGKLRKASPRENADLFFGVRGAHSNFGVITSFEYQLHPVGPIVLSGMVVHPLARGKEVLRFYRDYTNQAPDEVSAWAGLLTLPDGKPVVVIVACYIGRAELGAKLLQPLKDFGPPVADMIQLMPYARAQSMFDASFPKGRHNYWKSNFVRELSDRAIDILVEGFEKVTSPSSSVLIVQLGGAMSRVRKNETAFNHRKLPYDLVIMPMWSSVSESGQHVRWADQLLAALQPSLSEGVYVNYLGNEGDERVKAAYGTNYERLVKVKNKYDPTNLFRFNQNIRPSLPKR